MFSTDVRRKQRCSQDRPSEAPSRQEIVFAGPFAFGEGKAYDESDEEITDNRNQVERVERGQCAGLEGQPGAVEEIVDIRRFSTLLNWGGAGASPGTAVPRQRRGGAKVDSGILTLRNLAAGGKIIRHFGHLVATIERAVGV